MIVTDEQLEQDITPGQTPLGIESPATGQPHAELRDAETNTADARTEQSHAEQPHAEQSAPPQYGVGPFSIREVALTGVWLVAFVVSFFSVTTFRFDSVWTSGLLWILTIGVPTAAVFLLVLRRLSPDGIRRVGSLGIDQFASVAFTVSAVLWIQLLWETVAVVTTGGPWVRSWVMWVELVLMLAGVVLTVLAPFIPPFEEDFQDRREIPAHRNARPIRPVVARPAPAPRRAEEVAPQTAETGAPAAGENTFDQGATGDVWAASEPAAYAPETTTLESGDATGAQPTVSHQPFWALSPVERDVVDELGIPLFRIGPTAWALVIEDRGDSFVVRHEDGTVGILTDVSGITRG